MVMRNAGAMQVMLITTLVLHVLATVFWAGSTFTLARLEGRGAERLFGAQMGAAALAIVTGAILWGLLHRGSMGAPEILLAIGVLCALVAAGVQGVVVGGARRKLASTDGAAEAIYGRIAGAEQMASGLLALALILMTAVRFV
jgi:hypothetical protein